MEFGKVKTMTVGEVAKTVATEGGSVVAGLVGAGFVGKQFENIVKPGVLPTSSVLDKLIAYVGNNGPKVVLYMLLKSQGKGVVGEYGKDIEKGVIGSVVMDTLMRSGNRFAPGTTFKLFGWDVMSESSVTPQMQQNMQHNMQEVLKENSSLRQQLNNAMQRIASASSNITVSPIRSAQTQPVNVPIVNVTPISAQIQPVHAPTAIVTPISAQIQPVHATPPPDHDRAYGMMQTTPEAENRRKEYGAMTPEDEERRNRYGAMTPPIEDERNRRYGAMKSQFNFAGDTESIATTFGML